jgi:hypothetical protein
MSKIWNVYARWTIRQGSTVQCSPAFGVLAMVVAVVIVGYIYRELIIHVIEFAAITAAVVVVLTVATILIVRAWRRPLTLEPEMLAGQALLQGRAADAERISMEADYMATRAIGGEAEWLAAEQVNLALDEDGKLLVQDSRDIVS